MEEDWIIVICQILAAVYINAIIIIGGCTNGDTIANALSSVMVVELGQAKSKCVNE